VYFLCPCVVGLCSNGCVDGVEVIEVIAHVGGSPGACFGEQALFNSSALRTSTLRCLSSCELMYLKRKDLLHLLGKFPEDRDRVEDYARTLTTEMRDKAELAVQQLSQQKSPHAKEKGKVNPEQEGFTPQRVRKGVDSSDGESNEETQRSPAPRITFDPARDKAKEEETVHERAPFASVPPTSQNSNIALPNEAAADALNPRLPIPGRDALLQAGSRRASAPDIAVLHEQLPATGKLPEASSPKVPTSARSSPPRSDNNKGARVFERSPRLFGRGNRATADTAAPDVGKMIQDEIEQRIKQLPAIHTPLFKTDILNDPNAVAKVCVCFFFM
jgi:hypothetical protein